MDNPLSKNKEHDDKLFSDLNLAQTDLVEFAFENCTFTRCNLSGANLARSRFLSCKFENCDLSNAKLSNTRIRDTSFSKSKLVGIQWIHLDDLVNPSFEECILTYSNFVDLKLKKTKFKNCLLKEADFSQADLSGSNFQSSDLEQTRFNKTNLTKSDFRGARNYIIDPVANNLQGAKFSLPEAQGLLQGLGIVIEDL